MPPRTAASPSAAASTSRQWAGLLQNAAISRRHPGEAARLRPTSAATLPISDHGCLFSSSTSHLSTLPPSLRRRTFTSSVRLSAPPSLFPNEAPCVTPQKTTEEMQVWFAEHFPGIALPDNVLLQTATHESWNHGLSTEGHNRRLGFLGRRALQMFMAIFLHSNLLASPKATALLGSPDALADVMQTNRLGDKVGRILKLEQIMRWTPALLNSQRGPVETGLFKIRGVMVEALVGAIYHQHGAAVARSFFHAKVLPNLDTLDEATRHELARAIQAEAKVAAAVLSSMADEARSAIEAAAGESGSLSDAVEEPSSGSGLRSGASSGRGSVGRVPDKTALHSEGGGAEQLSASVGGVA